MDKAEKYEEAVNFSCLCNPFCNGYSLAKNQSISYKVILTGHYTHPSDVPPCPPSHPPASQIKFEVTLL